jgi:hypothetical protein
VARYSLCLVSAETQNVQANNKRCIFGVEGSQRISHLPTTPIALLGEVTLTGKSHFLAAGPTGYIYIQQLPVLPMVVAIAPTVSAIVDYPILDEPGNNNLLELAPQ